MKLSLSLVTILIGLTVATPIAGGSKDSSDSSSSSSLPGPPSRSLKSVKQQCSAKQSSIRCCNQSNKNSSKASSRSKVKHGGSNFDLYCNNIESSDESKVVSNFCSSTVACCFGDGCVAIAN